MTPSALGGRNKRWRFGSRGAPGGDEARGGKQGEEQCGANEVPHMDPLRIGLRCCTTISAANRQGMVNAGYPNWVNDSCSMAPPGARSRAACHPCRVRVDGKRRCGQCDAIGYAGVLCM